MPSGYKHSFTFAAAGGGRLYAEKMMPGNLSLVKGIVQIAHGMRESTEYYDEFADALARAGYGVVIHDARGHGRSAGEAGSAEFEQNAGYAGQDGFSLMVDDLHALTSMIIRQHPGVHVFLIGHSMGSVLSRVYLSRYSEEIAAGQGIAGLILSGTAGPGGLKGTEEYLQAAEQELLFRGEKAVAIDTPKQIFGHFGDRFEPTATGFEYMSRDEEMVLRALRSPFAGVPYRCGFYADFLRAMAGADHPQHLSRLPKKLPVFSVSGDMDPFGDYGEGVPALFELYRKHHLEDADYILYPGGRHEMLREINRREVFDDVIGWLDRHTRTAARVWSAAGCTQTIN